MAMNSCCCADTEDDCVGAYTTEEQLRRVFRIFQSCDEYQVINPNPDFLMLGHVMKVKKIRKCAFPEMCTSGFFLTCDDP